VDERFTGSSSDLEDIRGYSNLSTQFKLEWHSQHSTLQ
jgi:hypothetical protein